MLHIARSPPDPIMRRDLGLVLAIFAPFKHGFAPVLEFVLSSFFATFVDSKEVVEFVPIILTFFLDCPLGIEFSRKN
jgi:hypothetical protein